MATVVEKWELELDTEKAQKSAKNLVDEIAEGAKKAEEHGKAFSFLFDRMAGLSSSVINFYKQGISDAIESEKINTRLSSSLQAMGKEVENNTRLLKDQADAIEFTYGVDDKLIKTLQSQGLAYGMNVEAIDKNIKAAMTLSEITGQDLRSAFETIARIHETGTIPRTMQALDAFKGLTQEQIKNLDIADLVNNKYGEILNKSIETTATNIKRLEEAFGNLGESVGEFFLRFANESKVLELLTSTASWSSKGGFGELLAGIIYGDQSLIESSREMAKGIKSKTDSSARTFNESFDFSESKTDMGLVFGKGENSIQFETSDEEMVFFRGTFMPKSEADKILKEEERIAQIQQKNFEEYSSILMRSRNLLQEDLDGKTAYYAELEARELEHLEKTQWTQKNKIQVLEYGAKITANIMNTGTNMIVSGLFAAADGADVAWGKLLKQTMRGLGQSLIAQGIALEIQGGITTALALSPWGAATGNTVPAGLTQMAQGGVAIAAGSALAAGSFAGGGIKGQAITRGGSGGGSSGVSGSFSSGGSRSSSGGSSGGQGKTIIINVTGPVLDSVEFGVTVRKAINEANKVGV